MEEQKMEKPRLEDLTVEKLSAFVKELELRRVAYAQAKGEVSFSSFASDYFSNIKSLKSLLEVYSEDSADKFLERATPYVRQEGIGTSVPTPGTNITANIGQWLTSLGTYESIFQREIQMIQPFRRIFKEFRFKGKAIDPVMQEELVEHVAKAICRGMVEPFTYYIFNDSHKELERGGVEMSAAQYALALDTRLRECAIPTLLGSVAEVKAAGTPAEIRLSFSDFAPRIRANVRHHDSTQAQSPPLRSTSPPLQKKRKRLSSSVKIPSSHDDSESLSILSGKTFSGDHDHHSFDPSGPTKLSKYSELQTFTDTSALRDYPLVPKLDQIIPANAAAPSLRRLQKSIPTIGRPICDEIVTQTSLLCDDEHYSSPQKNEDGKKSERSNPAPKRFAEHGKSGRPEKRPRFQSQSHQEQSKGTRPLFQPKQKSWRDETQIPVCPHCGTEKPDHRFGKCPRKGTATDMTKLSQKR